MPVVSAITYLFPVDTAICISENSFALTAPRTTTDAKERRRKPSSGKRGKTGPIGPKGETGAWPAAAYDDLNRQIRVLREDVDDLRAAIAALQEVIGAAPRFSGRGHYPPSAGRHRSDP